jgi:hypothetical protein
LPYDGGEKSASIPAAHGSYFDQMRGLGVRDSILDYWQSKGIDVQNLGSIHLSADNALAIMTTLFDVKGSGDER